MSAHHIVCDGWSWWVLVRELGARYAQALDHVAELPAPVAFADYALAEAACSADDPTRQADARYWSGRFAGVLPVLELPTDRPRPARRSFVARRSDHVLDAALVSALRRQGARQGASLFATLLGGFAGVLSRLTGQDDLVIGIPAAGQSVDGLDQLVGHCVNLLPLRFALTPTQTFTEVLGQAQATLLDAIEHQRYTFGTLLKTLQVERDPSRLPLVSVMFNIDQALDQEKTGFPGLVLGFESNARSHESFELSINAVQVEGTLRLECQYNRDLFDEATIRRWLAAYEQLLRAAVAHGEAPVARLPLLEGALRAELDVLQPAPTPYDHDLRMHEHVERQCTLTPDAVALRDAAGAMSYAELEARANRIAHLLRTQGVRRGTLVGLALDRGRELVAGLLGILKAGAGYVPLDPRFPAERLAYMAGDAGLAALVTTTAHAAMFDLRGRPVLALDAMEDQLAAQPQTALGRDADAALPGSPAYVIYTSGSTGRPKGVQVPHRAVANFLATMAREPGLTPDDRLLAVTTLSFDIAVLELLLPLSVGAQVVVADQVTVIDGVALTKLLADSGATVMQATPATWRLLLEAGWRGGRHFKALCGGEPLPGELAVQLLDRCGELWNLYGPTETTVWSTLAQVQRSAPGQLPDIHIGRPVANTSIWILDAHGEPCPKGVPGELCIGGDGVTLGYLQRPELTAERFLADRFAGPDATAADGSAPKLYRTGDRARWRPDGQLEHLGRLDFQIKVRGYRIELGEIEATLATHPAVAHGVVLAREDRPGDVRLVAYVVAHAGATVASEALLAHLRQTLPDYMVPQHVVALDGLPQLPNGKLDRKALPAPSVSASAPQQAVASAPRDALEAQVLAAMEAVLGRSGLGVDEGFFAVGGHSLLAAQLCARLGRELDTVVPLRLLFDTPTAARLAAALRTQLAQPQAREAVARQAIRPRADRARAPMTLMQRRLWVLEQMAPGQVTYNTPSAHRLRGPIDLPAFEAAFNEMVRRQPSLRTCLVTEGDEAVQVVQDALHHRLLPPTDLSALADEIRLPTLMAQLEAMTAEPFVLDQAPLFRATLFKLGADDHVLYFMTHHAIWDGWSFDVFYSEMSALYAAYSKGQPSPLPPLEVDYGDFAAWHADWVEGPELAQQVDWWAGHLAGEREPLQLPEDRPRPAQASGTGGTDWVRVDRATADGLRQVGSSVGATLFMTLLAAYYVLLHRLSGQSEVVVGLPVRNRSSEALERVMGFFVNVLPLRMKIDPAQPFLALVEQVREAVSAALAVPDVPFEHLVRELGIARDPSRSPLYQALFSFQDVRARRTHWGELEHEHLLLFQKGMSNDIGLWFLEHDEGLSGALGYNADVMTPEIVTLFNHRFVALLQGLCRDPQVTVGAAGLLCAEDLDALARWNATAALLPEAPTLHGWLADQARRTPARAALRFGAQVLDYATLDARARAIAAALQVRGVAPGTLVGICLDRNPDLVASMIAVLKTGAAYVPLDPIYPAERLRFMAEDAQLALVLAAGTLADPLRWPRERLLLLDADASEIDAAAHAPTAAAALEAVPADPESAAYVIYTSGSTGKPKGVRIPHRAVLNFLASMARSPGLSADDRLLAVTTTSFDIAVLELFGPLSVGGEVVLASREQAVDGEALAGLIAQSGASVMQATPASWRMLLDAGWRPSPNFRALCGGEPLPRDLAMQLGALGVELWNLYGPTETTVWSTCGRVEDSTQALPVGTPIANTTVWILDGGNRVCPPGVTGELCIGGAGLALDYLHRPELTAERFVEVALPGHATPQRLYRTGDRGRWRIDGQLECLGRLDHQVKVRGHRIELGEIETVLASHRDLARAVVIVREDRPGDVRLVAYVVPKTGHRLNTGLLPAHLRKQLPDYMVPQHFVVLEKVPLLPNGKTDRNALPSPHADTVLEAPRVAPAGDLERRIAGHVAQVLGVAEVGADQDFFEIGGHSLLAVQLFHRLRRETAVNLPLAVLFSAPTVQGLARAYREAGARDEDGGSAAGGAAVATDPWAPLVLIRDGDSRPPLFLVHAVGGNVLNYRPLAARMPEGVRVYGLQAIGLDGGTEPLTRIEDMASRYVDEIRRVQPAGPYLLAGGSMGGMVAYEMARRLMAAGDYVALLGLIDTSAMFRRVHRQLGGKPDSLLRRMRTRLAGLGLAASMGAVASMITARGKRLSIRLRASLAQRIGAELPHDVRYAMIERAHMAAYRQYVIKPYGGRLTLFRANVQPECHGDDPTLGWSEFVDAVDIAPIPGSHAGLVETPELVRELSHAVTEALSRSTPTAVGTASRIVTAQAAAIA